MDNKKPKLYSAEIKNTGYPMDGHKAVVAIWDYDPGQYHLYGWAKEDDAVFAESMYKSEVDADICLSDNFDDFMGKWAAGEWEPMGVFCLNPDQVTIQGEYPTGRAI